MMRCLPLCVVLLILASPPVSEAQTRKSPTLGERFRSLFTGSEKPANPTQLPIRKTEQNPAPQPVQVTTRSGVLRQPGPEQQAPFEQPATPTFAPADVPVANQPPNRLETQNLKAKQLSGTEVPAAGIQIRDASVRPAAFETEPEKKTMSSWFRGLWSRKDNSAGSKRPGSERTAVESRPDPPAAGQSSSIDPRRVYRGPAPDAAPQDPRAGTGRGSDFSEIGVPRSSTEFRGRRDTSF
jgi:hypothetical protein